MLHVSTIPDKTEYKEISFTLREDEINIITPEVYWNYMLRESLYNTGYLPTSLYYLITTSTILQSYITKDIIKAWYREDTKNLDTIMEEIFYTCRINSHYFSQSGTGIKELEDLIQSYYNIKYINYLSDTEIEVIL
jgi:hypothetical protein